MIGRRSERGLRRRRRAGWAAGFAAIAAVVPGPASAWKPTTHAYLADLAIEDALDDGLVSIPVLGGRKVLTYKVDPETLAALRSYRAQYRAGVLGPDAYPDILTGQQVIHPDGQETGVSGGSDAWLGHIWREFDGSPQQRAFRLGFLTHAAGDMYGHTFVNHFTGGPFTVKPPENATKHIVLEGYVDRRLRSERMTGEFFNASIDGVDGRIYSAMIDARPGSSLDRILPAGQSSTAYSVPRTFSTLRANLERDIKGYYDHKADLQKRADDCRPLDFSCSRVALLAELGAYVAANGIQVTYKEHWRADIDAGLKAWPAVSHEVAVALFFNSSRHADVDRADQVLSAYATDHLLSMAGAPDAVGGAINVADAIISAITPEFLLEPIRRLKANLLDSLLKEATGMTKAELKGYLTEPERYFDQVMGSGGGVKITLKEFNRTYLKLSDPGFSDPKEAFDPMKLPAAYNTVIASKLILLPPSEIDRLVSDLGGQTQLASPNVMLGFVKTLDGSLQWRDGMSLAADCKVYDKVFKALPGGGGCRAAAP